MTGGKPLAAVGGAAALAYLAGAASGLPAVRLALKALPASILALWVVSRATRPDGRLVAVGLAASAAGDALLEWGRFLPGLLAFLAAHAAYVGAFVAGERRLALGRLVPFAAWSMAAYATMRPGLGTLALPVAAYVAVITVMMWRAAARVGSPAVPRRAARLGLAGAIAFGASDTLLALDRFAEPLPDAQLWIMVLYWLGQWAIAASAVTAEPPRS
jgi:uncharacterized membrane protein YhhN